MWPFVKCSCQVTGWQHKEWKQWRYLKPLFTLLFYLSFKMLNKHVYIYKELNGRGWKIGFRVTFWRVYVWSFNYCLFLSSKNRPSLWGVVKMTDRKVHVKKAWVAQTFPDPWTQHMLEKGIQDWTISCFIHSYNFVHKFSSNSSFLPLFVNFFWAFLVLSISCLFNHVLLSIFRISLNLSVSCKKKSSFLSYFFCKKIPLSRRVGYVMGGSVSGSVRDVCNTNQIGCTIKHQSNFLL